MNLQEYIYDNGTDKFYYVCTCCGCKAMRAEYTDDCGAARYYLCMNCGSVEHTPLRIAIVNPVIAETVPSEAWIGADDYYNIMYFTNAQMN
jgi:hypothetical protein